MGSNPTEITEQTKDHEHYQPVGREADHVWFSKMQCFVLFAKKRQLFYLWMSYSKPEERALHTSWSISFPFCDRYASIFLS